MTNSRSQNAHRPAFIDVLDETAALRWAPLPTANAAAYAKAHDHLPTVARVVERHEKHKVLRDQLVEKLGSEETLEIAHAVWASAMLEKSSEIAEALLPVRSLEDMAHKMMAAAPVGAAEPSDGSILDWRRNVLRVEAFALSDAPAPLMRRLMTGEVMFASNSVNLGKGHRRSFERATTHGAADAATLSAFATQKIDFRGLLAFARVEFARADAWTNDPTTEREDATVRAKAADHARLRAYSALVSIVMWPPRSRREQYTQISALRLVRRRSKDALKMRSAVDLAEMYGQTLEEPDRLNREWSSH